MEKRQFRPGYHVELTNPNGKPKARYVESTPQDVSKEEIHISARLPEHYRDSVKPLDINPHPPVADVDVNMTMAISPSKPDNIPSSTHATMQFYGRSNVVEANKEWIREIQRMNVLAKSSATESQGNQGLKVAGIVLASIGFLLFLFISWLIGLIVMLLGLGLLVAGLNKPSNTGSSNQRKGEPTWQDVVYLKNGSVIKGLIIEQVPNESLKIQTADGSIFVYEMDKVAKIAKEQK